MTETNKLAYANSEIKHTFITNESGEHRDIVEFSTFSDGSIYLRILHRSVKGDNELYSKTFKSLAEFKDEKVYGYNTQIISILQNKIMVGTFQGMGIPMIKVLDTKGGMILC